jgi:hypothetical protein
VINVVDDWGELFQMPRTLGALFGFGGNVMRLPTICAAILVLAAGGAFAQESPSSGRLPSSTTGQAIPQAPVGHRQPTLNDLPPDVAHKEQPAKPPAQESQKANIDRRLKTSPGRAGGPPTLQVGPSCDAAGAGSIVLGRNKESCLADETTAQDTLKQNWSKYSADDKTQCVGMEKAGGPASYVELVSCLEIMRDARNIQNTDPLEGDLAPVTRRALGTPTRTRRPVKRGQ